ncbi:hypothetical protein BRC67_02645, partial [Halobacteriales archaeon QH_3_68_24]
MHPARTVATLAVVCLVGLSLAPLAGAAGADGLETPGTDGSGAPAHSQSEGLDFFQASVDPDSFTARFADGMARTVASAENATGREMALESV